MTLLDHIWGAQLFFVLILTSESFFRVFPKFYKSPFMERKELLRPIDQLSLSSEEGSLRDEVRLENLSEQAMQKVNLLTSSFVNVSF